MKVFAARFVIIYIFLLYILNGIEIEKIRQKWYKYYKYTFSKETV